MTTPRRGYAIIEMLLVISAMTIILALCVALISALLKLDRIGRAHLNATSARARLGRQFRQDVRAAERSKPGPDAVEGADRLELEGPDGLVIEYRAEPGRLVRTERKGDAVGRRESFALLDRRPPRFRVRDDDGSSFVSLGVSGAPPGHAFQVDARLGGDRRLSGRKEAPK